MVIQSIAYKFKAQAETVVHDLTKGAIAIETTEPAHLLQLMQKVIPCFLSDSWIKSADAEFFQKFDTFRIAFKLKAEEKPLFCDILSGQYNVHVEDISAFLLAPAREDCRILFLEHQQIQEIIQAIVMPYNVNFPVFFKLLQAVFKQNSHHSNPGLKKLQQSLYREKDTFLLLATRLNAVEQQCAATKHKLQQQIDLRDRYEKIDETNQLLQEKISAMSRSLRTCKSKLRKIKQQKKQLVKLAEIQKLSADLHAEKEKMSGEKERFEKRAALEKQQQYFQDEIAKDQQIISRLQREIAAIGDLPLLELEIEDRETTYRAFIGEATAWLDAVKPELANLEIKGRKIKEQQTALRNTANPDTGEIQNLEMELEELRRAYAEKKAEVKKTAAELVKIKKKENQLEYLRQELSEKREILVDKNTQTDIIQQRIQQLSDELQATEKKIAAIDPVEFDTAAFERICADLQQADKILTFLRQIKQESELESQYQTECCSLAQALETAHAECEKNSVALQSIGYDTQQYIACVDQFEQQSRIVDEIYQKLEATRSALFIAEKAYCSARGQRDLAVGEGGSAEETWEDHFRFIIDDAHHFIKLLWRQAGGDKKTPLLQLALDRCGDVTWWGKIPLPRKRLAQLSLSFACRNWLQENGLRTPQFLFIDDSLAAENIAGKFRHRPILQHLLHEYEQVFWASPSLPEENLIVARIS